MDSQNNLSRRSLLKAAPIAALATLLPLSAAATQPDLDIELIALGHKLVSARRAATRAANLCHTRYADWSALCEARGLDDLWDRTGDQARAQAQIETGYRAAYDRMNCTWQNASNLANRIVRLRASTPAGFAVQLGAFSWMFEDENPEGDMNTRALARAAKRARLS